MNGFCITMILCCLLILFITDCASRKSGHKKNNSGKRRQGKKHQQICDYKEDIHQQNVLQFIVGKKMDLKKYPAVYLVPKLKDIQEKRRKKGREPVEGCPNLDITHPIKSELLHERSISPWTLRIDYDEDRFPQELAFAECSCKGCISSKTGKEDFNLTSVLVYQKMMVLRRKPCPDNSKTYIFELNYEDVPVACTCAVPK
ncbi:interleukin-17C-like [Bombina bombina]|uniref:interleukin-17C-like n=1 Tax=Bombina bombina TaxID=8345 RepID=UPI00235A790D|nr:interleukin-17C-like [Bombina bombina]